MSKRMSAKFRAKYPNLKGNAPKVVKAWNFNPRHFNSIALEGHPPSKRDVKDRAIRNLDQLGWQ